MVIYIIFNTHNRTPDRFTKEWIEYRIDIFERYTLQSIKEQTNQDFRVYLCCEKITMPIIHECLAKREPLPDNVRFDTIPNNNKDILRNMIIFIILDWTQITCIKKTLFRSCMIIGLKKIQR